MVPAGEPTLAPLEGPPTVSRGPIEPSRGTNTGPSHCPLLGAQHRVSRTSNGNQQGNQHWHFCGPTT
jgi:hypothetical protein